MSEDEHYQTWQTLLFCKLQQIIHTVKIISYLPQAILMDPPLPGLSQTLHYLGYLRWLTAAAATVSLGSVCPLVPDGLRVRHEQLAIVGSTEELPLLSALPLGEGVAANLELTVAVGATKTGPVEETAVGRHPLHEVHSLVAEVAKVRRVIRQSFELIGPGGAWRDWLLGLEGNLVENELCTECVGVE